MLVHCLWIGNLEAEFRLQAREGVDVPHQFLFVLECCHMLFLGASNKFTGN